VPFTLVHARKYDRRQINNTDNTESKHKPEKANSTKHSKINKTTLGQLPFKTLGKRNEMGLF